MPSFSYSAHLSGSSLQHIELSGSFKRQGSRIIFSIILFFLVRELFEKLTAFLGKDYAYFINGEFQNNEIAEITDLINVVAGAWDEQKFKLFKKILEEQLKYSLK